MNPKRQQAPNTATKRSIRIPDLLKKQKQKMSSKSKHKESIDILYDTDSKKCSKNNSYFAELQQMKIIMQSCNSCLQKMSQFKTKKPTQQKFQQQEKSTQTLSKPFLIDLIEERVTELCRQNRKLTKLIIDKQSQIADKNEELNEIQDKFTNILYTLAKQLSQLRLCKQDIQQFQSNTPTNTDTPSFMKALMMDKPQ